MMLSKRSNDDIIRYKQKIGCLIQIPNIGRGQLKFVGTVDNKPGYYAGVDLLAPIGKNNGTFNGRRYFNTEYPKSGLFIQLPKVAQVIDQAEMDPQSIDKKSRRSTLSGDIMGSMRRTQSPRMDNNNPVRTPTPTRNINMTNQRISSIEHHSMTSRGNDDIEMGGLTPERNNNNNNNIEEGHNVQIIKEYELKLEKQNRKLLEYERLLNDQRIVLEEIQPTIDEYDKRVNDLELERNILKEKLIESQSEFDKQLKYFETENKQLTDVVSQLHEDLRSNEEYIQQKTSAVENTTNVEELQTELKMLTQYKQDMENAQLKWNKEKEQLKMHNESLSKEYQTLNKEYMMSQSSGNNNNNTENNNEELIKENDKLKNELELLKNEISSTRQSIPPYTPSTKVDTTAGRELWCSLCEKSGHDQIDCPYQYESSNRPHDSESVNTNEPPQYF